MIADNVRFAYLYQQYISKACTPAELSEFFSYISDGDNKEALNQLAYDHFSQLKTEQISALDIDWEQVFTQIERQRKPSTIVIEMPLAKNNKRKLIIRRVAAACIIALVGIAVFFISKQSGKSPATEIVQTHDVAPPKETRAVITLADGSKVYLDSVNNGTIAQQDNVNVVRSENGAISYNLSANGQQLTANSPTYNTLTNPRGSKVIDMQLSDGSHVWLNAGSSVTYPVAFAGNERKVQITGEAYFEVAHDAGKPFIVTKGETSVTVLGTHFNVNAYDDEDALRITLLQGSVKVSKGSSNALLKPGQQAQVAGDIKTIVGVDTERVIAWKNGLFSFDNASLPTVMRQIARWYDVDVSYAGKIPEGKLKGKIPKDLTLSQLLNGLTSNRVHFKIDGNKKITIYTNNQEN
jgi:ferric-dicitrate binding protein FerR (iron transport regulator)